MIGVHDLGKGNTSDDRFGERTGILSLNVNYLIT